MKPCELHTYVPYRVTFVMLCLCLVVVNCTFSIMGPILPQGETWPPGMCTCATYLALPVEGSAQHA